MAIRTITVEQLTGGNFVGGGNDTLMLSGERHSYFDLTKATFSGFSTITTDADFSVKMTSAQFDSLTNFQFISMLRVTGPIVDIRGKTITNYTWGIWVDDNSTIYADDVSKLHYLNAYENINDRLQFFGTLSQADRARAHNQGYDVVVDDTGLVTTNPPPVIANLSGERQLVQPGQIVLLDASSDATVSDDQGTIHKLIVEATNDVDSIRIIGTDRLALVRDSDGDLDIIFDGVDIGNFSKDGGFSDNAYVWFGFTDNAPAEAVNYILQRIEFVRGSASRYDNTITISAYDKSGRMTTATVTMAGVDGSRPDNGSDNHPPTPPTLSNNTISEAATPGTVIGRIQATDPDGDMILYGMDNNYGGLFQIDSGNLVLNGTLDFEQRSSYTLQVLVGRLPSDLV